LPGTWRHREAARQSAVFAFGFTVPTSLALIFVIVRRRG
jgi:hypothetical protein